MSINQTYFVFYDEDGEISGVDFIDAEDAEDRLTWDWDESISYKEMIVDEQHFFRGYYFYNDWSELEDEEEWESMDFISDDHAYLYEESNNSGGHFQMVKLEEYKDGKLVKTTATVR